MNDPITSLEVPTDAASNVTLTDLHVSIKSLHVNMQYMQVNMQNMQGDIKITNKIMLQMLEHMEGKFNSFDKKFEVIDTHIKNVEEHMKKADDYMDKESDFQELRDRNFVANLYIYNYPAQIVSMIPIKFFFSKKDNEYLTDFDGFLFCSTIPPSLVNSSNNEDNIRQQQRSTYKGLLQPNTEKIGVPQSEYILIEAKHSLSKQKVDYKLKQLRRIQYIFQLMGDKGFVEVDEEEKRWKEDILIQQDKRKTAEEKQKEKEDAEQDVHEYKSDDAVVESSKYKEMMEILLSSTHHDINHLNYNIILLFSSDDISKQLQDYIKSINEEMDEATYNVHTFLLYLSDPYVIKLIPKIIEKAPVPRKMKGELKHASSIEEVRTVFAQIRATLSHNPEALKDFAPSFLDSYLSTYAEMRRFFAPRKGNIGVVQFNKCTLFAKSTLNI